MKIEKVNIGEIIRQKVEEKGLNKSQFAKLLGMKRQNVDRTVFNKTSIDTNLLCDISEVLDCNLFDYYKSNEINDNREVKAVLTLELNGSKKDRTIFFTFENEIPTESNK